MALLKVPCAHCKKEEQFLVCTKQQINRDGIEAWHCVCHQSPKKLVAPIGRNIFGSWRLHDDDHLETVNQTFSDCHFGHVNLFTSFGTFELQFFL